MDALTEHFIQVSERFTELRARMRSVAHALREAFPEATIQHDLDFAAYSEPLVPERGTRCVIELFVEITFQVGNYRCWWIDVEPVGDVVKVEASLRRDDGAGEDALWERTALANSVQELFANLSSILDEIEQFAISRGNDLTK